MYGWSRGGFMALMVATKTDRLVASASRMVSREIRSRVLLTDYIPKTNVAKQVRKEVKKAGLEAFKTRLHRARQALRGLLEPHLSVDAP